MALKNIKYVLEADGMNPDFEQYGGTQCDHRVAQLYFQIKQDLYNKIKEEQKLNKLVYRYDCFDGEGNVHQSNTYDLSSAILEPYVLEYDVTKFGGKLTVCVVISVVNQDNTLFEYLNYGAKLYLKNLPDIKLEDKEYKSVSALAEATKLNAQNAKLCLEQISEMQKNIGNLKLSLENSEWVFDCNKPESELDIDFVVENEFSSTSNNALANGVITDRFKAIEDNVSALKKSLLWQNADELVDIIKSRIFLEAHPIGSYYWSSDSTSPEIIFGGCWKQIKDTFVLAAGDDYTVDSIGGEAEHRLTKDEMPIHNHMFMPNAAVDGIDFVVPTQSSGDGRSSIIQNGGDHSPGHWASQTWGTHISGGNLSHNNMPPYLVAYCWQRIDESEE